MENIILVLFVVAGFTTCIWAARENIKQARKFRLWVLKEYISDLYKIPCVSCNGDGHEGYGLDGEPTGDVCEDCDSYGFVWRFICPPKWLKHSAIWRQTEVEDLRVKFEKMQNKQKL